MRKNRKRMNIFESRITISLKFLILIFSLWALFIFLDFSGINTHKVNGKAVNVILGFSVYGIYAKIMDIIQLTILISFIYGIVKARKLLGYMLPIAYMIYSFVSMHSFSIMMPEAPNKVKLFFDLFSLIGGGTICLLLFINRRYFNQT
ncbi:MAG: hypothetical protein D6734_04695 [Candidatus Schekmanbacteria bacterium]|nr:MAG: hypothetical protein D6734_04695 [Candidatus Schekmanbacteria bacterium]